MPLYPVTPPPVMPISLDQARAHLRVDHTDENTLIQAYLDAVVSDLDGRDGHLGRALVQQTWDLKLNRFCSPIRIPLPPLRSVDFVKYVDSAGAEQTLDPAMYQVHGVDGWGYATVRPAYGQSWPSTLDVPEAVTVRFTCGYKPTGASPNDYVANVPGAIKSAMLLMIGDLYMQRETIVVGVPLFKSGAVDALLAKFRVLEF